VLTNMLAELGTTAEARAESEALADDGFSGLPFDEEWEVSLLLAETAVRLVDQTRAATLYELLLPYADRVATSYPEISLGPISRFLEILAATTGHNEEAIRHLEAALAMNERIGARSWLAHTYDDYAHMLLRRGKPRCRGGPSLSPRRPSRLSEARDHAERRPALRTSPQLARARRAAWSG
jgi:hypothetical protein